MIGEARAMGAISVVNALACGKGTTVAVKLPTTARVELLEHEGGWRVGMNGRRAAPALAVLTAKAAVRATGRDPRSYSGSIDTWTAAPVGVGLKTSSSSSVAIVLAVLSALGERLGPADVLKCSASASLAAGVSVTGATDDAASCLIGGVNSADNATGRVVSSARLGTPKPVMIRVPKAKSRRGDVPLARVRQFSQLAASIFETGARGKLWEAMTLNGLLYSTIYGYSPYESFEAVREGALGSGLSGTGPATAAVFNGRDEMEPLAARWGSDGATLIRTETSDRGASLGP